jgi:hypothetical protein
MNSAQTAGVAVDRDIVGAVRYYQVRLGSVHQSGIVLCNQRITAKHPVLAELPKIAAGGYSGYFNGRKTVVRIRLIDSLHSVDQYIDLSDLKAGNLEIEVKLQF